VLGKMYVCLSIHRFGAEKVLFFWQVHTLSGAVHHGPLPVASAAKMPTTASMATRPL
jgi:hypothetical protein